GGYDDITGSVSISVTDDDQVGFVIVADADPLVVDEGFAKTITVRLATLPTLSTGDVTVTLVPSSGSDLSVDTDADETGDQTTLTFTTADWKTAQTVTVKAGQDDDATDDSASIALNAKGGDYEDIAGSVSISVTDDDETGLVIVAAADPLVVDEGLTKTFTVSLATKPTAEVTVTLVQPSDTDIKVDTDTSEAGDQTGLTFTTSNWSTAQTVTVRAAEDADGDDETAAIAMTAKGGDYEDEEASVNIKVADNDRRFIATPNPLTVEEGESGEFTVALGSRPTGEVSVTLTKSAASSPDVTFDTDPNTAADQNTLTFTTENWNTTQTVTVSVATDADAVKDEATITLSATGANYESVSEDVSVKVTEKETAGYTFDPASPTVDEGSTDTFTVALTSQPSVEVTVTLAQPTDNTDVTLDTDTGEDGNQNRLIFTTSNWSTAQTVTVEAAQDPDAIEDEATIAGAKATPCSKNTISISSSKPCG
ncbi:MAG: hypothetical protein ISN28_01060, partial [Ectothiorhodospiraceae bacterium AqS1]|nr:hypothetical protein [Ectothiorhodospiraceae bacterium AqS1]